MKIYTGNFANAKKYANAGYFLVSIALSANYFHGACYRKLNPDWAYMNDPEPSYVKKYEAKLRSLNALNVVSELKKMSNGKDVVLLCHEAETEFCHRQLVAKWLSNQLGIEVKELGKMSKSEQKIDQQASLF